MEKKIAMLEMEVSELRLWKSDFEKKSIGNKAFSRQKLRKRSKKKRLLLQQIDFKSGVAFSAYLSTSFKAASFGKSREMVYDKIECNVGNGYDNNTGTFRAPIKGTYSFTWSVCASGVDQGELGVEL
ncbi:Hypothetical predicted protein [Mytilus galloprovincialis]|uniref:C1q domain-containing protein n=1 Tax=Mytilus galloprovincialis TaxID=29158 RepID=A0A8B6HFL3_MYTGA|nr:Hypothetical predicted protein [Mytilus galloprovincialis]